MATRLASWLRWATVPVMACACWFVIGLGLIGYYLGDVAGYVWDIWYDYWRWVQQGRGR